VKLCTPPFLSPTDGCRVRVELYTPSCLSPKTCRIRVKGVELYHAMTLLWHPTDGCKVRVKLYTPPFLSPIDGCRVRVKLYTVAGLGRSSVGVRKFRWGCNRFARPKECPIACTRRGGRGFGLLEFWFSYGNSIMLQFPGVVCWMCSLCWLRRPCIEVLSLPTEWQAIGALWACVFGRVDCGAGAPLCRSTRLPYGGCAYLRALGSACALVCVHCSGWGATASEAFLFLGKCKHSALARCVFSGVSTVAAGATVGQHRCFSYGSEGMFACPRMVSSIVFTVVCERRWRLGAIPFLWKRKACLHSLASASLGVLTPVI
jgi:hypothetical protein